MDVYRAGADVGLAEIREPIVDEVELGGDEVKPVSPVAGNFVRPVRRDDQKGRNFDETV